MKSKTHVSEDSLPTATDLHTISSYTGGAMGSHMVSRTEEQ